MPNCTPYPLDSLGSRDETQAKLGKERSTSYFVVSQQSDAFAPEENVSGSISLWFEVMKKNVSQNRATLGHNSKGRSSCWNVPASVQTRNSSLGLQKIRVATLCFIPTNKQFVCNPSTTVSSLDSIL